MLLSLGSPFSSFPFFFFFLVLILFFFLLPFFVSFILFFSFLFSSLLSTLCLTPTHPLIALISTTCCLLSGNHLPIYPPGLLFCI